MELVLSSLLAAWGEPVSGWVRLLDGPSPEPIGGVSVSLQEQFPVPRESGRLALEGAMSMMVPALAASPGELPPQVLDHGQAMLAVGLSVRPGEEQHLPFTFDAPWGRPFYSRYWVRLEVTTASGRRQSARRTVYLQPAPVFQRAAGLLGELTQTQVKCWGVRTTLDGKAGKPPPVLDMQILDSVIEQERYPAQPLDPHGLVGVTAEMAPRGWTRRLLDGIRLEMVLQGSHIWGTVIVNPQEHSVADFLRSLTRADRVRFPVAFESDAFGEMRRQFLPIRRRFLKIG